MSTPTSNLAAKVNELLVLGVTEARAGNKAQAADYFKQVLAIDSENETALMWCATLTNDPFEAKLYLQHILHKNPQHSLAKTYYELAQRRCEELEGLLSNSSLVQQWRNQPNPNSDIPRLGQYCMRHGWVTELQIRAALHYQEYLRSQGHGEKLGDIMISFGYIDRDQLKAALDHLNTEYNNRFND